MYEYNDQKKTVVLILLAVLFFILIILLAENFRGYSMRGLDTVTDNNSMAVDEEAMNEYEGFLRKYNLEGSINFYAFRDRNGNPIVVSSFNKLPLVAASFNKLPQNQNLNIIAPPPPVAEIDPIHECTDPGFIKPSPSIQLNQINPDIGGGRYIVWNELDQSSFTSTVYGYDLGPNMVFENNGGDDVGPILLDQFAMYTVTGIGPYNGIAPRVNDNGYVVYVRAPLNAVLPLNAATGELVVCNISNCQATTTVLETLFLQMSVFGFFVPNNIVIYNYDIGDNNLIYARRDVPGNLFELINYSLVTGTSQTVTSLLTNSLFTFILPFTVQLDLHVGDNNDVASFRLPSPTSFSIDYFMYIPSSNTLIPLGYPPLATSLPPGAGGFFLSGKGYIVDYTTISGSPAYLIFYPVIENNGNYVDIGYINTATAGQFKIFNNDQKNQGIPRTTSHTGLQKTITAFFQALSASGFDGFIRIMAFNPSSFEFSDYSAIYPPQGYAILVNPGYNIFEVSNSNITVGVTPTSVTSGNNYSQQRVVISHCY